MLSKPDLTTETSVSDEAPTASASTNSKPPKLWKLILASLAIFVPGILAAMTRLSLPMRGISAVLCGLAVLLCGSYLLGQALDHYTRRIEAKMSEVEPLAAAQG